MSLNEDQHMIEVIITGDRDEAEAAACFVQATFDEYYPDLGAAVALIYSVEVD